MRIVALALLLLAPPARGWFWQATSEAVIRSKALYQDGRYPQVITALAPSNLQKLRHEDLPQAYLYLGMSYQRLGRLGEALSTYQLAAKLFPKDINLLSELADMLHQAGLDEQAAPIFEKVVSIHPNNARGHLGLAEIDRRLGLLDASADHYERSLEMMPDQARLWRDYAEVLLALRDVKTADLSIHKSLALAADPEATVDLAFIQRADGRLEDAIASLDNALKAAPARGDIILTRGLWLLEGNRYADAGAAAAARLKENPNDPLALWIAARVSLRAGRFDAALKDLRGAAAAIRSSPFVARAAAALLAQLKAAPPPSGTAAGSSRENIGR